MRELTPRMARKKRAIVDQAARVLAVEGRLSMSDLVERLDVSRATIYRYFPTREDLIRDIALAYFEDAKVALAGLFDDVDSYERAFALLFESLIPLGHYHFLSHEWGLLQDAAIVELLEVQRLEVMEMVVQAQAAGEFDPHTSAHWIVRHFDSMVWIAWESLNAGEVARNDIGQLAFKTFWSGVSAKQERTS